MLGRVSGRMQTGQYLTSLDSLGISVQKYPRRDEIEQQLAATVAQAIISKQGFDLVPVNQLKNRPICQNPPPCGGFRDIEQILDRRVEPDFTPVVNHGIRSDPANRF